MRYEKSMEEHIEYNRNSKSMKAIKMEKEIRPQVVRSNEERDEERNLEMKNKSRNIGDEKSRTICEDKNKIKKGN